MDPQLLKLTVLRERVRWELLRCGDGNSFTKLDWSKDDGIPLDRDDLGARTIALFADLQQLVANLRRSAKWQPSVSEAIAGRVVEALGEHLYRFLFRGNLAQKLNDALHNNDNGLLRIELEFQGDALKEYGTWPWEYLRSPMEEGVAGSGQFLALRTQLVLNRRLFIPGQVELKTSRPVVLLVVAGPPGRALSAEFGIVQAERVVATLRHLHETKIIDLVELIEPEFQLTPDWRPTASWDAFKAAVRNAKRRPDVIHFIGHGQRVYDPDDGQEHSELIFVGPGCTHDAHRDIDFVQAVGKSCKLIFLQACESGVPGPHGSATSVGQLLAHDGTPAVVAMQMKVENIVANQFAEAFYKALSEHKPVDWAVREGREAIQGTSGALKLAFGVPVLFLRSYEALISPIAVPLPASMPGTPAGSAKVPEPKPLPFTTCPRCGSTRIKTACAACGLRFYCEFCPELLDIDPAAPRSNPMLKFCKACSKANEQTPWSKAAGGGELDKLQEAPPRLA